MHDELEPKSLEELQDELRNVPDSAWGADEVRERLAEQIANHPDSEGG